MVIDNLGVETKEDTIKSQANKKSVRKKIRFSFSSLFIDLHLGFRIPHLSF